MVVPQLGPRPPKTTHIGRRTVSEGARSDGTVGVSGSFKFVIAQSIYTYGTNLAILEPPWTLSWWSLSWRPPPPHVSRRLRAPGGGCAR